MCYWRCYEIEMEEADFYLDLLKLVNVRVTLLSSQPPPHSVTLYVHHPLISQLQHWKISSCSQILAIALTLKAIIGESFLIP